MTYGYCVIIKKKKYFIIKFRQILLKINYTYKCICGVCIYILYIGTIETDDTDIDDRYWAEKLASLDEEHTRRNKLESKEIEKLFRSVVNYAQSTDSKPCSSERTNVYIMINNEWKLYLQSYLVDTIKRLFLSLSLVYRSKSVTVTINFKRFVVIRKLTILLIA